ncbi:MAG: MTAP family purine nucleoside phosphorylase [Fimbriimonadaceae bacterium]|nr:MTAP family purine nucleoside phosphorylase [Fimbriimonadaceae bacterium]
MQVDGAIIGGTGIGERLAQLGGTVFRTPTPDGLLRGRLIQLDGVNIALVSRHLTGHKLPPHRVNFRAMALGLRSLGARFCLATAAVGSLDEAFGPGSLIACSDWIDVTARNITLYDQSVVHRDFSYPFSEFGRRALVRCAEAQNAVVRDGGVYVCVNGPRYETPHEIQMFRQWGGTVVGMTAVSEAIAMREAEIEYACLTIVTNYASGISTTPLSHQEVVDEMERTGDRAVNIIVAAAQLLAGGTA